MMRLLRCIVTKMIDIAKLSKDKDIGKWVEYKASHGATERGRIKGWNNKFIFVVYKCGGEWDRFKNFTGQATYPRDLKFINHTTQ